MACDGSNKKTTVCDGSSPYELLYPIVKQSHQTYISNGSLVALDIDFAFDIRKPMGGFAEWHMLTFNHIRILEELNKIKKYLFIRPSQSPYELLYQVIKPSYQAYLSNGTLAALDNLSAFDIQKPMGGFAEWHIVTFNQIRILEEVNEIKKALHVIFISCDRHPQSPYELLYPIVKQVHQIYLNNGSLAALDRDFAFDIQKPMGDFKEWRLVTFNQIRILEELNGVFKTLNIISSPVGGGKTPYELYYPIVKREHQSYLINGTLVALDKDLAFDIQKPMGGFTEWHMITFNQIRILEEIKGIEKIVPAFKTILVELIECKKRA